MQVNISKFIAIRRRTFPIAAIDTRAMCVPRNVDSLLHDFYGLNKVEALTERTSDLLLDDFTIIGNGPIGTGGFSAVFHVTHDRFGEAAMKLIEEKAGGESGKQAMRVANEVKMLLRAKGSPMMIQFIAYAREKVEHIVGHGIVTELYSGGDLSGEIQSWDGHLPRELVIHRAAELNIALIELRRLGIIHRDLKPSNCLLDNKGRLRIADFGLAVPIVPEGYNYDHLHVDSLITNTSSVAGTFDYMSPEALLEEPVGFASDTWSVGVCVYELLSGRTPWVDRSTATLEEVIEVMEHMSEWMIDIKETGACFDLRDYLAKVTTFDAMKRPTPKEIQSHPLFKGVDWAIMSTGKAEPPTTFEKNELNSLYMVTAEKGSTVIKSRLTPVSQAQTIDKTAQASVNFPSLPIKSERVRESSQLSPSRSGTPDTLANEGSSEYDSLFSLPPTHKLVERGAFFKIDYAQNEYLNEDSTLILSPLSPAPPSSRSRTPDTVFGELQSPKLEVIAFGEHLQDNSPKKISTVDDASQAEFDAGFEFATFRSSSSEHEDEGITHILDLAAWIPTNLHDTLINTNPDITDTTETKGPVCIRRVVEVQPQTLVAEMAIVELASSHPVHFIPQAVACVAQIEFCDSTIGVDNAIPSIHPQLSTLVPPPPVYRSLATRPSHIVIDMSRSIPQVQHTPGSTLDNHLPLPCVMVASKKPSFFSKIRSCAFAVVNSLKKAWGVLSAWA